MIRSGLYFTLLLPGEPGDPAFVRHAVAEALEPFSRNDVERYFRPNTT
jgi:hypothetical protein